MDERKEDYRTVQMTDVLSVFRNVSETKTSAQIKQLVVAQFCSEEDELFNPDAEAIKATVDKLLKEDRKRGELSDLQYKAGKYRKRKTKHGPDQPGEQSRYFGTAAEIAVMAELLFNDYNVNRMVIDDGLDLVATKDNRVFYIQVKSTLVKPDRNMNWQIDVDQFRIFSTENVRYVLVARYSQKGKDRNMYFVMTPRDIERLIFEGCIKRTDANICIKIRTNEKSGDPMFYDSKEASAQYYLDRFNLDV